MAWAVLIAVNGLDPRFGQVRMIGLLCLQLVQLLRAFRRALRLRLIGPFNFSSLGLGGKAALNSAPATFLQSFAARYLMPRRLPDRPLRCGVRGFLVPMVLHDELS